MPNGIHILIVEDDPLVAEVLQATLAMEYRTSRAKTLGEARALFRTSHFDLLLIDPILSDGRADEIIELAEAVDTRVVTMSGYPADTIGLEHCVHPHLEKPFGRDMLMGMIERVLRSPVRK